MGGARNDLRGAGWAVPIRNQKFSALSIRNQESEKHSSCIRTLHCMLFEARWRITGSADTIVSSEPFFFERTRGSEAVWGRGSGRECDPAILAPGERGGFFLEAVLIVKTQGFWKK